MWKLLAFLLFLSFPRCLNAAITIDDFSSGPLDITLTESAPSSTTVQIGLPTTSVIGGVREHLAVLNGPILPGSEARILIDTMEETFRVTSNASIEGNRLTYGSGPDLALDLDLSGLDAFRFDVLSSAEPGLASMVIRSGINEGTSKGSRSDRFTFPASATAYSLIIPFSSFFSLSTPADFSDIDFIRLNGGGFDGFDFILDGIFVVPEPSSLVLLLVAAALVAPRFRRR